MGHDTEALMEYHATINWQRTSDSFTYETYNRDHEWIFHSVTVPASTTSGYHGDDTRVNPEEGFIAALSSCHMLTFLAICTKRKLSLDAYRDEAIGYVEKNEQGKLAVTRVVLRPHVTWSQGVVVSAADLDKMHHQAHENCFIANSVKSAVTVEPRS
jgi:organic hydroperoxide reductase OsmC/OhrA